MSDAPASDAPAAPAKSKLLIIILCCVLAAGGAAGAGMYFMSAKGGDDQAHAEAGKDGKDKAAPKAPAVYVKFDPPFVVNFENKGMVRFLQVSVEVMTRDPLTADIIRTHNPKLRNDLLMLLGGQSYETISTREGKERLRGEALGAVANIVVNEGGKVESVEQLYFTSFVMQ